MSSNAFLAGIFIILAIQANAIWGKMFGFITSVRDVIISGFVLTVILSTISHYL